ncbi:efflux transporter outer membrane subunit [Rosenbergiella epipactidis]|uniref:efflux transporter outer membrane subunit n=1 Tax=Rosenbergiella epipactidis TaxID=1544694 RepID=UPI001F4EDEF2|nr:efflux transporter outer membrane subunit [Rosenbergiella epipactidis]
MKSLKLITHYSKLTVLPSLVALSLCGCTVGPEFHSPTLAGPPRGASWHSGDPSLQGPATTEDHNSGDWWKNYQDPVLNQLVIRALNANPDLQTAALHFLSAQAQAGVTASQLAPQVDATGQIIRQQISENGSSTRAIRSLVQEPDEYVGLLASPYTSYQIGVNASWEIDFWGHVRRSVEAAKADLAAQQAMLKTAQLSIISDLITQYSTLRNIQQQIDLAYQDQQATSERLRLIAVKTRYGQLDYRSQALQQADESVAQAKLINLRQQEAQATNQILLLVGEHPGSLHEMLMARTDTVHPLALPTLSVGLSSDTIRQRPDIQAAEAKLHAATARIGVAKAELYPRITLTGSFGLDTYNSSDFSEWASRTWSIGPHIDLPLFDYGRRKSTIVLREVDQQQAAVAFHKTVLTAWQEIDDALSRYAAAQQTLQHQRQRAASAAQAYALAQARYQGGATDFIDVIDSQRSDIQARIDLANAQRDVMQAFVAINRASGNVPSEST